LPKTGKTSHAPLLVLFKKSHGLAG
jgi:hypothetical protein